MKKYKNTNQQMIKKNIAMCSHIHSYKRKYFNARWILFLFKHFMLFFCIDIQKYFSLDFVPFSLCFGNNYYSFLLTSIWIRYSFEIFFTFLFLHLKIFQWMILRLLFIYFYCLLKWIFFWKYNKLYVTMH